MELALFPQMLHYKTMTLASPRLPFPKAWLCAAMLSVVVLPALPAAPFQTKGPEGKAYAASITGNVTILIDGKVDALKTKFVYQATGTAVATQDKSGVSLVMSNGTRLFLSQSGRLETRQFSQDPFIPGPNDSMVEPSPSQNLIHLAAGSVAIDTAKLSPETIMMFTSPNTHVNIQGGKVVIVSTANGQKTYVNVLQGSAIVQGAIGAKSFGDSYVVKAGQRASITSQVQADAAAAGGVTHTQISADVKVLIQPIPDHEAFGLIGEMNMAITGGRSVYLDTNENYLTSPASGSPSTAGQLISITSSGDGAANPALTGALDGHSFDWSSVDWNNLGSTGLSSLPFAINASGTSTTTVPTGGSSLNDVFSEPSDASASNPGTSGKGVGGSGNGTTPTSILDLPNIPPISPSSL